MNKEFTHNNETIKIFKSDGYWVGEGTFGQIVKKTEQAAIEEAKELTDSLAARRARREANNKLSSIEDIFGSDDNGGDDVSLESALAASKKQDNENDQEYQEVEIDGDIYEFEIEEEVAVDLDYILKTLTLRNDTLGGYGTPREVVIDQHLAIVKNLAITNRLEEVDDEIIQVSDTSNCQAAVDAEQKVLDDGDKYFAQGYRYRETGRSRFTQHLDTPDDALIAVIRDSGHIAASPAYRKAYLVMK